MNPYYEHDGITIYHGDCREVDAWDIAGAVMVTDPPYGMGYSTNIAVQGWSSRWIGTTIEGDANNTDVRDEILARWAPRPALVFATWKRPWPAGTREILIWDKVQAGGMGDLSIPWRPSWEAICVIGPGFMGRRDHGVLSVSLPMLSPERKWHPTPKPLGLMRRLVGKCPPLAPVVDPFMGSGSTLRAAMDLGREAIGVEIDERYCEIAAKRCAQRVLDLR